VTLGDVLSKVLDEAWEVRTLHFPNVIGFYRPVRTKAVSLTGLDCALRCAHCGGHYLKGMCPPDRALAGEYSSFLVSGGCDRSGSVPLMNHSAEIEGLKAKGRLNVHTGLVGEEEAIAISRWADTVSFDLILDDRTIKEVLGLEVRGEHFAEAYCVLKKHVRVVPHVLIGILGGELRGETACIDFLADNKPCAVTLIVFMPTPGTAFAHRQPPPVAEVARLIAYARMKLPDVPVFLGCMRPGGAYRERLDPLAVAAGVNKIVNPAPAAKREAEARGLVIEWGEECCGL